MNNRKQIAPLLRVELATLAKMGLVPDAAKDFEALLQLNEIAHDVIDAGSATLAEMADIPQRVGNVTLRRMTLGSFLWLTEYAQSALTRHDFYADLAALFALSRSHTPNRLPWTHDTDTLLATLKHWQRGITCSMQDLITVADTLIPAADPDSETPDGPEAYGGMIAALVSRLGHDRDYWIWKCPLSWLNQCINHCLTEQDREIALSGMKTTSGGRLATDPVAIAIARFRRAAMRFRRTLSTRLELAGSEEPEKELQSCQTTK